MDAWKCPEGWRVKEPRESMEAWDAFSHNMSGKPHETIVPLGVLAVGLPVSDAILYMPNGGYILTPVSPATSQLDVSPGSQNDDMAGWEIYEPVVGEVYSPGTQCKNKLPVSEWQVYQSHSIHRYGDYTFDDLYIYRRPIQKQQAPPVPLDIDLPYLLKKSAACSPSTQADVLALKAKFADEVGKLIEADRAQQLSLSSTVDQKVDCSAKGAGE